MPIEIVGNKKLWEETSDSAALSYNNIWYFKECGARLVELMPISPSTRLLDVATGSGAVALPAALRVGPRGHVTGIDLSAAMLQQAKEAIGARGLSNVDLLKMDAEHLDFPDASFDAVTCSFGIFFFPDMGSALNEMYRVCKPGGLFGITVFDKTVPDSWVDQKIFSQQTKEYKVELKGFQSSQFAPEEIEQLLTRHGFHSVKTVKEIKEKIFTNLEDIWDQRMGGATRAAILSFDEETRARFKEEYLAKLRQLSSPSGFRTTIPMMYSIAQR